MHDSTRRPRGTARAACHILLLTSSLIARPLEAADDNIAALAAAGHGDFKAAFKLLQPLAESGDARAQYNLGVLFERGQGVDADAAQAMYWYLKSAKQGNADAQFNVGNLFRQGKGAPADDAEAARWYQRAAETGNAAAQANLGYMYANGRGLNRDPGQAIVWYTRAAEAGVASAELT